MSGKSNFCKSVKPTILPLMFRLYSEHVVYTIIYIDHIFLILGYTFLVWLMFFNRVQEKTVA